MSRPGRAWYRKSRRMFFFTCPSTGKQVPTGVTDPAAEDQAEAVRRAHVEQLASAVAAKVTLARASGEGWSVSEAVGKFLADRDAKVARGKIEAATVAGYRLALAPLVAGFGPRAAASLAAEELEEWADRPGWSSSTRNGYLGTVQTLLKFAKCPIVLRRPPKESRGAETCLTDAQFAAVLAAMNPRPRGGAGDLRQLLVALRETGARPQELARLTAEAVDWANGCARLKRHKTRKQTGRDRVIYFNSPARAALEAQRAKHGSGLLFRTKGGNAYRAKCIVRELRDVSKKVGFRVIAYGLGRHSFATNALANGVPDAVVAELLGHTGTAMVHKNYSHLGQRSQVLREAAERASGRKTG